MIRVYRWGDSPQGTPMRPLICLLALIGCGDNSILLGPDRNHENTVDSGDSGDTDSGDTAIIVDTGDSGDTAIIVDTDDTGTETGTDTATETGSETDTAIIVDTDDTATETGTDTAIIVDTDDTATDTGTGEDTGTETETDTTTETGSEDTGTVDTTDYDLDNDGYLSTVDDCDDTNAAVYPGNPEDCMDGVDNDCDPTTNCELAEANSLTEADYKLTGEDLNDSSGKALSLGDVNGDGYCDMLIGQPGNSSTAGGAHLVYGPITGDLDLGDRTVVEYTGTAGSYAGYSVALDGDLNGDGNNDVVVGAYQAESGNGSVYVDYTPGGGDTTLMDQALNSTITGTQSGKKVTAAGDLNNDGFGDLAIGSASYSAGYVYILNGSSSGVTATDIQDEDALVTTENASHPTAISTGGDIDGDGCDDLVVGDSADNSSTGATYLVYGPLSASTRLASADAKVAGEAYNDLSGASVDSSNDLNNDGYADLVIGAYGTTASVGAAYIVYGPLSAGDSDLSTADAKITGDPADGSYFGWAVAAGDLNDDGAIDLAVGTMDSDSLTYLFYGAPTGTVSASSADATYSNEDPIDSAGYALATGDTNADGYSDLLIGAYLEDSGGTSAGAAYLLLGNGF